MDSIPKTASFRLVPNGIIVTNQTITNSIGFTPETRATRTEGDIGGFSKASRLRFRRLLATAYTLDQTLEPWGACLTIPGPIISQERAASIWHSWSRNNCRRSFGDIPMIWRVELQTRKQTHWHVLLFLPRGRASSMLRIKITDQWLHLVRSSLSVNGCLPWDEVTDLGFDFHGVIWTRLHNPARSTNYLAPTLDHETKHKQEQLGWRGRQWGIINRKALHYGVGDIVSLQGTCVGRIIGAFKDAQERRRASGRGYVGAGVGEHWRLPSVLFGSDADVLEEIVRREL